MRNAKWISPLIVGLGLAIGVPAATAGLLDSAPGACKPVGACEPVKKVEPLPRACEPAHVYAAPVHACEPLHACEPVQTCDGARKTFVLDRVANRVDRAVHAVACKLHTWKQTSYVSDYSPAACAAAAPVPAPAPAAAPLPAPLPAAPVPVPANHS